ncbi:MAG: homocysteine biosynthesis protein [Deltaproteobacteria bacterium]|nr:homocysteine biosynthesis protein [Candidatus Anaeroferrophillacea bacterium]
MAAVKKTIREINERIRKGEAVVVTAEEMIGIVADNGAEDAARHVDVVTTGTFSPMCSSGAFLNLGHAKPRIRASKVWLNNVPACGGIAAVDLYLGATEPTEDDPLNKVHPGEFRYGGGHVIEDLVAGRKVHVYLESYGTACYPNKVVEKDVVLADLPQAILCNPRNCYQNYNCGINLSDRTIYTYMGILRPNGGNVTFSSAGQLSPLLNDPYYRTIGLGTRIFLGGAEGYVTWYGTQHNPAVPRGENGVVRGGGGTLFVMGDLKKMSPRWLMGVSIVGYGCSLAVGIGIPIPIIDEHMARFTAVRDDDIFAPVVDYSYDYPMGTGNIVQEVSYGELRRGTVQINGRKVPAVPLSSYSRAREIAETLKTWIANGMFTLGEPQMPLPGSELFGG